MRILYIAAAAALALSACSERTEENAAATAENDVLVGSLVGGVQGAAQQIELCSAHPEKSRFTTVGCVSQRVFQAAAG